VCAEGAPHVLNSFLGKCVYGMRKGHFFLRGRLRRAPSAQAFGQAFGHHEAPLAITYATIATRVYSAIDCSCPKVHLCGSNSRPLATSDRRPHSTADLADSLAVLPPVLRCHDVLHPESKQQTTPAAPRDALDCVAALARTREYRQNCVRFAYL
jgi:hypothetical protein